MNQPIKCKICQTPAHYVGIKKGEHVCQDFHLYQCSYCHFSFIENSLTNYSDIYTEQYYRGNGAMPRIDYLFDLEYPKKSIKKYENDGIVKLVSSLVECNSTTKWLDFGCGTGSLVRHCRDKLNIDAVGFDEGWIKERMADDGVEVLSREALANYKGQFDVVTAIEVLEHTENPLETLKLIRSLLKPGGLFFYTTGNAKPFRNKLLKWRYIVPEVHISFFEPNTMALALTKAGFVPEQKGWLPGFFNIIRYKILLTLHMMEVTNKIKLDRRNFLEKLIPWKAVSRIADKIYKVSDHPIAWNKCIG